ncbi:MAG: hypothetical protein NZ534_11785, partial [Bacteroidia bacterium]|nr:hypothetical protein [Bacteroidia bacterium]
NLELAYSIVNFYEKDKTRKLSRDDTLIFPDAMYALGVSLSQFMVRDSFLKAISYHYRLLRMFEAVKDSFKIGFELGSIGAMHMRIHNYELAADYTLKAMKYAEKHDQIGYISLQNNLGLIYMNQKKYEKAAETFEHVISSIKQVEKHEYFSSAASNAVLQFVVNGALNAFLMGDTADLTSKTRMLRDELSRRPSDYFTVYLLMLEAQMDILRGDDRNAEQRRRRIVEILPHAKAWRAAALLNLYLGEREMQKGLFRRAVASFRQAISYPELPHKLYLEKIYRNLAGCYRALQAYDSAYHFLHAELHLRDSIAEIAKEFEGLELLHRYENEKLKTALQNAVVENEKRRNESFRAWTAAGIVGAATLIFIPLSVALWLSRKRIRRINSILVKRNNIIARQKDEIQLQAKALGEALEAKDRLDKFKETMMHLIVHDLKSPLNMI